MREPVDAERVRPFLRGLGTLAELIPLPSGWRERSLSVGVEGRLRIVHFAGIDPASFRAAVERVAAR